MILKNDVSTKMDGYQKLCDINKNVIKMGVIIKRVHFTRLVWEFFKSAWYQYLPGYTYNRHDNLRVSIPNNHPPTAFLTSAGAVLTKAFFPGKEVTNYCYSIVFVR